MATLSITKYSNKVWKFIASDVPTGTNGFSYSKLQANTDGLSFVIVAESGATTNSYQLANITVYASEGGTAETGFATMQALLLRLEELNFPAWNESGGSTDFNLRVQEGTNPEIQNVNKLIFDGATVTDNTDGSVTITITGGGATPNLEQVLVEGNTTNQDIIVQPVNPEDGYNIKLAKEEGVVVEYADDDSKTIIQSDSVIVSNTSGGSNNLQHGFDRFVRFVGGFRTDIKFETPTGTGEVIIRDVVDETETIAFLSDISGGGGVQSVTGDGVDNTDPDNPVISFPTPTEIGLGNVDNTSDLDKPISNATQTALNAKTLPLISDTPLSTVTGVNVSTILTSYQIPANTLTDYNRLIAQIQVSKSGGVGTSSLTFNLNTSNSLTGATQIATSSLTSGIQFANLDRKYSLSGTNITGYPFSASASTDGQNSSAARGSATYNRSNAVWFIIAVNPASIGETHVLEAVELNARRTKTTI